MTAIETSYRHFIKGDIEPFYRHLYPGLVVYASRLLGYELSHLAQDCVQDVVLNAFKSRSRLDTSHGWYTYILKSVYNSTIDVVRKYQSRTRYVDLTFSDSQLPEMETAIIEEETLQAMRHAISLLPERMQTILRLNFVYGLKNKEIAERLGIAEITVKKEKAKMLHILRDRLGPETFSILLLLLPEIGC